MQQPSRKVLALGGGVLGIIILVVVLLVFVVNSDDRLPDGVAGAVAGQEIKTEDIAKHTDVLIATADGPVLLTEKEDCKKKPSCKAFLDNIAQQATDDEIRNSWTRQEAKKRGITVSEQELKQTYLKRTPGQSEADYLQDVRDFALSQKLYKAMNPVVKPTEADLKALYKKRYSEYNIPAQRRANIITTKTLQKALKLKQELVDGKEFRKVAIQGDDPRIALTYQLQITKGNNELSDAVFAATPAKITGPVKTKLGYVVFIVVGEKKAANKSYAEVRGELLDELSNTFANTLETAHEKEFSDKWKKETVCAQKFQSKYCGSYSK